MTVLNLGSKTTQIALFPTAVGASTTTGSAIDLAGYEGDMVVLLDAAAGYVRMSQLDSVGNTSTASFGIKNDDHVAFVTAKVNRRTGCGGGDHVVRNETQDSCLGSEVKNCHWFSSVWKV